MGESLLPSRRVLRTLTLAGILAIIASMAVGYWSIQSDDAYIFYSYAKNIVHGHGYVFNPGDHVNATSSPLYTLLLAFFYFIFRGLSYEIIPLIGHLIGMFSLIGAAFFLMFGFESERDLAMPYLLPLVFLGSPFINAGIGMEMPLALMCVTGALFFYVRNKQLSAALVLSLAVLARPDMIMFSGIMFVHFLVAKRQLPRKTAIAVFVLPLLCWFTFSWFYFGNFIPTTLAAKLAQPAAGLWGQGHIFLKGFSYGTYWYPEPPIAEFIILPLALIGLLSSLWQKAHRHFLLHTITVIIVSWNLIHLITYAWILDAPAYEWYYTPFALGIGVLAAVGVRRIYYFVVEDLAGVSKMTLPVILAIIAVVAVSMPLRLVDDDFPSIYYSYRESANWLNENAPPGSSVGANDIGVLRFFYENGRVICAGGLVNPDVIPHLLDGEFEWYIHEYQPDYLMFIIKPHGIMVRMVLDDWFKEMYELQVTYDHGWRTIGVYQRFSPPS